MSVTDSGDMEMDRVQYGDHEFQIISINIGTTAGEQADEFLSLEPLGQFNGLDPDEVAELVYYRNELTFQGSFEFGLGLNMADDDFPEQAPANHPTQEQINVGLGEDLNVTNYREAGIIDFFAAESGDSPEPQFRDTERLLRDETGSGPYVDQTDNIDVHFEVSNQTGGDVIFSSAVQLIWNVLEVDEGIPEFALPTR